MARKPSWDDRKKKYDAHGCMLTSLPDELWTKYKDAKIVDLSLNKISSIPSMIKELTVIEELYLKDNNLQIFPDAVCQLKSLKMLNLESNSFTSVSYNIIQLNQLQEVNLLKSGTPTFPRMICRIPSLKRLHFGFKDLPFRVTSLPDDVLITLPLEELYLYNCNFSLFPKVIFKIKSLKVLSLVWCKISDELNNLGELSNLKQLTLSCNDLTSLPESIGSLSKLEVLHANKNKLASLPAVMKKLSKLKTIDLDDNAFSKGKSMACENKSSKVKSIISQAPVTQGGQKPPVESQQKQSVLQVIQVAGTKRLSTPTHQSPLKSSVSTQQSRKQPGKEEAKPIATPTYGSSMTSLLQSKQSNTQPGKAETKITGMPTGKSTTSMTTGSGTTTEKRISSAPSNTRLLLSTPRETLSQQVSRGVVPTRSKMPTSSVLEKKEIGQSLQRLLHDRERKQEELGQKQKIQQQQTQQQRQQSTESKHPGMAKTASVSSRPSPGIGKYPMERTPRGQAVIINNDKFGEFERRKGTQFDKENLQSLLKKLHFGVHTYNDLGASDMENVVKTFSLEDHSNFDCFVCFVLSHGSEGKVSGVDGKSVEIRDLTKHFSAENCKTLASKPKLFFIQACQGQMSMGGWMPTDAVFGSTLIPNEADFVIGYSTVPGHVSYRNIEQGSYYIKTLVNQLQQLSDEHDLVSILAKVREEVSRTVGVSGGGNCTQVPTVVSTLGKQVYLKS